MASKHHPEAYDHLWKMLGRNVAEDPKLSAIQNVQYFGGGPKMRSCLFEPDGVGSYRIFFTGKVRIQFFRASSVSEGIKLRDASTSFTDAAQDFVAKLLQSDSHATLPESQRFLVDTSSGPVGIIIPPATLVVQEALDGLMVSGIRRSFSPYSTCCVEEFKLCVAAGFSHKDFLLSLCDRT